jgi:hypothetical protein
MTVATVVAVLLLSPSPSDAFVATTNPRLLSHASKSSSSALAMSSIVTGPAGKAASSFEQDLLLTLQIIRDHEARSTTVSTEQFIQQEQANAAVATKETEAIDISVPYDAAAQLAYDKVGSTTSFAEFKASYVAQAVASVVAKKQQREAASGATTAAVTAAPASAVPAASATADVVVDLSIPYDAAARLAYEKAGSSGPFDDFKRQYEADAVASVIAKRKQPSSSSSTDAAAAAAVDLSIPYDAAARLAYAKAGSSGPFDDFKRQYEMDAVASVIAKRKPSSSASASTDAAATVNLSIPYDAAARLAYAKAGSSGPFDEFKRQYEAQAVADVTAKQQQRRSS